jgi:hypothetical protein
VETHVTAALHIFRLAVQNHALRVGLAEQDYRAVEADLLSAWDFGEDALTWQAVIHTYWADIVGDYFEFVRPRPEWET